MHHIVSQTYFSVTETMPGFFIWHLVTSFIQSYAKSPLRGAKEVKTTLHCEVECHGSDENAPKKPSWDFVWLATEKHDALFCSFA